jgi:hydrogenase nickel incorporation protein HypB
MTKIDIQTPILDLNEKLAAENRKLFDEKGVFVLDLMASPGAGKTSTILATIAALRDNYNIAVIEGDIASSVDAEKIKAHGIPAVQINTGGACHLEANMIKRAIDPLDLDALDLIIVENVGNLVCPTEFYLGEHAKVMILSIPEGHDKPYKYPNIFQISEAVILNKYDTLPVFDFDEDEFNGVVASLNPKAPIFKMSATKGEGVDAWARWLKARIDEVKFGVIRDNGLLASEAESSQVEDAGRTIKGVSTVEGQALTCD